jgi:hypothetical protein
MANIKFDEKTIQATIPIIISIVELAEKIKEDLAKNNITLDDIKALTDRVPAPDTYEEVNNNG